MSDAVGYVIVAAVVGFVAMKMHEGYKAGRDPESYSKHCTTCGTDAVPKEDNKGHGLIEIVLWLCFLVPGLLYSIWRRTNVPLRCPACNATTVVPMNSPVARSHKQ